MKVVLLITIAFLSCTTQVALADEPLRVVSLKPAITDTIIAMGHADRLVGVTKYCDIPKGEASPVIVGDYTKPYTERIIALQPDIILNSKENSSRKSVDRLEKVGARVELLPFGSKEEILGSVEKIGELIGDPPAGKRLASSMRDSLSNIESKWKDDPKERILIVWGRRPLVVAGGGSFIEEYLSAIGAVNVVGNSKISYPRIGLEELISLDPDVIVDLSMGSESDDQTGKIWHRVPSLKAMKSGRIYTLNTSNFRPGPRLIAGLDKLAGLIHAE